MPPRISLLLALLASAPAAHAWQRSAPHAAPATEQAERTRLGSVVHSIPGTVRDLSRDSAGRILYVTAEKVVGRIDPASGGPKVLASTANSTFPVELRAVAETPSGDLAVLDVNGHVRLLFGADPPATMVYNDLYMIHDATDLIVDARGSYLITSLTPSSEQRAVNWIQDDGSAWSYFLVRHQPVQLAHDPLTGGLLLSETSAGGNLRLVEPGDPYCATQGLDTSTHPGVSAANDDGDVACEENGDLYWIAGGSVYRRNRAAGTTTLFATGFAQLRGVVIARSSAYGTRALDPMVVEELGHSLYLAEGANPTLIREIPGVGAPADLIANDQGPVPWRGSKVNVTFGFQAFDLAPDNAGRLLLGGTVFGSPNMIKRVTLTGTPSIVTVANTSSGLAGIIEGLCVAPDDAIFSLTRDGVIQRVTEGPLTVTTVFSDPFGQITAGKDLALDLDGTLYAATREGWDFGKVMSVSGGVATLLALTEESRGLAANPMGGLLVSQWHNTGFHGTVDQLDCGDGALAPLPGFSSMNYTNDFVWGDGDVCVDSAGSVYTVSEDDWALVRYDPAAEGFVRIGSGYLNHPSGLAIAPSTATSGSTTGWSLYVAEFDFLWEKPSVLAPASTLVDSSLPLARTAAVTPHPRYGKPNVLAPAGAAHGGLIGTAAGWLLAFDTRTGAVRPLAGPADGLHGKLVAVAPHPDGVRALALNADGQLFAVRPGRARALAVDPLRLAAPLAEARQHPQRILRSSDPLTGVVSWLALEGWVVWRTF